MPSAVAGSAVSAAVVAGGFGTGVWPASGRISGGPAGTDGRQWWCDTASAMGVVPGSGSGYAAGHPQVVPAITAGDGRDTFPCRRDASKHCRRRRRPSRVAQVGAEFDSAAGFDGTQFGARSGSRGPVRTGDAAGDRRVAGPDQDGRRRATTPSQLVFSDRRCAAAGLAVDSTVGHQCVARAAPCT